MSCGERTSRNLIESREYNARAKAVDFFAWVSQADKSFNALPISVAVPSILKHFHSFLMNFSFFFLLLPSSFSLLHIFTSCIEKLNLSQREVYSQAYFIYLPACRI